MEKYPLLDSYKIIEKKQFKDLFASEQILVDKDLVNKYFDKYLFDKKYIHTQRMIQKESFEPHKYGLNDTPIYEVFEPYSDKQHPSTCAFSILNDTNHYEQGTTILSIGLNPYGDDDNKDKKDDKPKSGKNMPSILKNDCKSYLEATRRNLLKHAYCTSDIKKPIKQLVQTDLYTQRTTNGTQLADSSQPLLDSNFKNIEFWIEQADIIVPNWGSKLKSKQINNYNFHKLMQRLHENIGKVYVINFNKHGSPTHSSVASKKYDCLKKVGKISEQDGKFFPAS